MTTFENLTAMQKYQATLHRDVRTICTETGHFLGLDITKPATDLIAEIVFHKLSVYGKDLEAFAKHAKRTVVNGDDVKLLVRRNPSLTSLLNEKCPTAPGSSVKEKRRKTLPNKQQAKETKEKTNVVFNADCQPINQVSLQSAGGFKVAETETTTSKDVEDMIVDQTIDLTFD